MKVTSESFAIKAGKIHNNKYSYSKVKYVNQNSKVIITCPFHGDFEQVPHNHLRGIGCYKCANDSKKHSLNDFTDKAVSIFGDLYDYSQVKYVNCRTKVGIVCRKHGVFYQTPHIHLQGHGCSVCKCSSGELKIRNILVDRKLNFKQQYKIEECKHIYPLPFDFAVFDKQGFLKCLIEYQGKQHYGSYDIFGGEDGFKLRQIRDFVKEDYCTKNGIPLIVISCLENLEDTMEEAGGLLWD